MAVNSWWHEQDQQILADAHALIGAMPVFIVAFVVGVCALQQMPRLPVGPELRMVVLAAGMAGLLAFGLGYALKSALIRRREVAAVWYCAVVACGLGGGFGWAAITAQWRMNEALPEEWEGRDIVVTGVVASLPAPGERAVRFDLDVEGANAPVPPHIGLSWYSKLNAEDSVMPVHAGERWRMVVRLKQPHGQMNPHGFDYEAYLLERGIRATGYVRPDSAVRLDADAQGLRYDIQRLRERIRERFYQALPAKVDASSYAGVLVALTVGDQSAIPAAQWQVFARTGITHLMSISGLHVTMLAALAYALSALLWRALARRGGWISSWLLNWPLPRVCSWVGLMAAAAYCALAGFGLPAQRTLYMLGVVTLAQWTRRNVSFVPGLALALWVVVLLDPWAVLSPGFWLSFGAVTILLWTAQSLQKREASRIDRWIQGIHAWGRAQWVITVAMLPVLLALFGQFSLISPLTNAFAIPVVSFVVTPLALFAAVTGNELVLIPTHALLAVLMQCLEAMAAWPLAIWQQAAAPWGWVALALIGAVWMLAPQRLPWRGLSALLFIPLLVWQPVRPAPGEAWVRVLDVGQGLAVHVQTHSHDAMFDTGPAFSAEADAGNRLILPYLRAVGVHALDALFISHGDSDHAGGAASIVQAMPVGRVIHSLATDSMVLAQVVSKVRAEACISGLVWEWDQVRVEALHPENSDIKGRRNASSCVLRIEASGHAMLLPSDIEAAQESVLVRRRDQGAVGLSADVLVAPHHGSRTSSTQAFIDAVAPSIVIFPVGYRNSYGHPADDVVNRYRQRPTQLLRTDREGAVMVRLGAQDIDIEREREVRRRYWHGG